MVYLNNVIGFINDLLKDRISNYPTATMDGVMNQTVTNQTGANGQSRIIIYPSIIDLSGKANYTGLDKRVPFTGYHRLMGSTFTRVVEQEYGDDLMTILSVTDIQLIVWGWRDKINHKPEQFALILADTLPAGSVIADEFKTLGIRELKIVEAGITYDQRTIFNQEIQGVPYFLGPETFVFSIRYRIEGSYIKGCLNKCEC